jgi:hypothetical protein
MGDLELFPPPVLKIGLSAVENSNNREREYSRSQATRWEPQMKAHGAPKVRDVKEKLTDVQFFVKVVDQAIRNSGKH